MGFRGTGSRGVENMGSGGKHRVWWKTRRLVENTGYGGKHVFTWKTRGTIFRQNMNFPHNNENYDEFGLKRVSL